MTKREIIPGRIQISEDAIPLETARAIEVTGVVKVHHMIDREVEILKEDIKVINEMWIHATRRDLAQGAKVRRTDVPILGSQVTL